MMTARIRLPLLLALILVALPGPAPAQRASARASAAAPRLRAIRDADLRRDLFAMASDSFRGREAGTLDEWRASLWLAERARAAGLRPAGDDGTYFQLVPMRRVRVSSASRVELGGQPLALWRDAQVIAPTDAVVDVPVLFLEQTDSASLAAVDVRGKAIATVVHPPRNLPAPGMSLWGWRYTRAALAETAGRLLSRGAAAVLIVSDSVADANYDVLSAYNSRGTYGLDSAGVAAPRPSRAPVLWLPRRMLAAARAPDQRLVARISSESFIYPSVNVVAKVRGTGTRLRSEYVLFSGHQDHDGVRVAVNGDSIWNGADDNASVSVALLAIGRAFVSRPGRRSALFVWHGAEERGLIGSRWFAQHPTVPKGSIVAVLNGDMIGRNHPDSAALLGVVPPHRNSTALVAAALAANRRVGGFALDSTWDAPTHPEGWYFRSDHLPYARAGIPALFFTTLLHPDYHTPRDEATRIDYAKLTRMARWMYATGWAVANTTARPGLDPGFRLER
jgi:hypothetical protein